MLRGMHPLRLAPVVAVALGLMAAETARSQEEPGQLPPVDCTVTVGFASAKSGIVAAEFGGFQRQMPHFKSVRLLEKRLFRLHFGEWARVDLPSDDRVDILPVGVYGERLHMQFKMPGVLDTSTRLQNRKGVIVGGRRHKDGFLVIQVEPDFSDYLPEADPAPGTPPSYRVNDQR